ncbi:hypothetical protein [Geomicrobium sediminis]|uniref:Uncharacterized protein n=1 Tax=Geomicrobium sediminis TaxID=1347788 RepID=A0ABS2PF08_9BACL|nr:hypothetical protein [Geomicrobium sediminis]MBM7633852.1 hypothetical protein [Geomicrobium sediminis]
MTDRLKVVHSRVNKAINKKINAAHTRNDSKEVMAYINGLMAARRIIKEEMEESE